MRWAAGLERIGPAALARPRLALVFLAVVMAAAAFALPGLRFDDDINRVFLSQSSLSQAQRRLEASFVPKSSDIAILFESNTPMAVPSLAALRDLSLDLELEDGVLAVLSPFALRSPPGGPAAEAPLFDDSLNADSLDARLAGFRDLQTGLPTLIRPDRRALMMLVSVEADRAAEVTDRLRAGLATGLPDGLRATLTGEEVIARDISGGLKRDLLRLNGFGAVLLLLGALVLLNDLRLAVLATVPALLGAVAVLGLAALLGYPVTVISNVVPILILVLGVSNGIHLGLHLQAAPGPDIRARLANTLAEVGPACALSTLTTALAFGTIFFTGNAQLREFAILGAAGMVLAFAVLIPAFVVLTLALSPAPSRAPRIAAALARALYTAGRQAPRLAIAAGLALTLIGAVGFLTTRPWFPLYQNLPLGSVSAAAADRVAADFGGAFRMVVELDVDVSTAPGWDRYRRAAEAIEAAAREAGTPDGAVLSLLALARWSGNAALSPPPDALAGLPGVISNRLLPLGNGQARIMVAMPEPMRGPATLAAYDRIEAAALTAGADRVLGLPAIMRHESVSLIRQLSLSLISAAIAATAIIALALRTFRLIPALFLPNVLPILLTGSALHLVAGGLLTPVAVLSLTIAFGIAVDDTIHFASRYLALRDAGTASIEALDAAARRAGPAMALTTLLLLCGLCVTQISAFEPIRLFGGLLMFSLIVALVLDLVLLPSLLVPGKAKA